MLLHILGMSMYLAGWTIILLTLARIVNNLTLLPAVTP